MNQFDYTTGANAGKVLFDAALAYAASDRRIFPLRDKDTRLTARGWRDATTDLNQIREWWTEWPEAWIGMPTGPKEQGGSGIDAVNLTGHGLAKFPAWESMSPVILWTPTQWPDLHNNLQLLFRSEGKVKGLKRLRDLPRGNDLRGIGEYIILPPSPGYRFWRGEL